MPDLIIYQLPDKTVLKEFKPENSISLKVGSVEKLDNSDDRFVIRKIEEKSKTIYFDRVDKYRGERIRDNKSFWRTYVTVEIDLEWRNNQLKIIEQDKKVHGYFFYSSLVVFLISFFISCNNSNKQASYNPFIDIIGGCTFISTLVFGLGLLASNERKYTFTELKNNQDSI